MSDGAQHPAILASDAEREATVPGGRRRPADPQGVLGPRRVGSGRPHRRGSGQARIRPAGGSQRRPPSDTTRHLALCSRIARSGPWEIPVRSAYRCLFGTIDLDLGQARLAGPEVEIEIFNLFGTVTLIVPEGVRVSVEGGGAFASQVIHSPRAPPVPGAPLLRIKTSGPGGTLHVRNQRERPNRWFKLLGKGDPHA